jgi:adenosylcobinamide-GDP ribazoletransferase
VDTPRLSPAEFLRRYLAAMHSFTRLPVRGGLARWTDLQPETLRASARHFPGVGLLVGMVACVVFALFSIPLPDAPFSPFVAAVLATIATVLLTGGAHEAALARFAASLERPAPGGAYASLALLLVVAAKLGLLAVLGQTSAAGVLTALFAGHAVSRFWPLLLATTLPYIGGERGDAAQPLAGPVERPALLVAGLWCVLPLLLMVFAEGVAFVLLAVIASALAMIAMGRYAARHQRGNTGDSLGATQQVGEAAFYLGAAFGVIG